MYYTLHHCNEPTTSSRITLHDRIIQAISKNVIANNTALVEQYIPIHKPPHFGVVVAGLEVIQPTLGIVIISSVPNGVDMGDVVCIGDGVAACIGDQEQLAPGIVGVITNGAGVLVPQADDVTLQVVHIIVVILRGVVFGIGDEGRDTVRRAGGIVDVLDLNGRNRFTVQGGDSALTQRRTACRVIGDVGDAAVGIGDGLSGAFSPHPPPFGGPPSRRGVGNARDLMPHRGIIQHPRAASLPQRGKFAAGTCSRPALTYDRRAGFFRQGTEPSPVFLMMIPFCTYQSIMI